MSAARPTFAGLAAPKAPPPPPPPIPRCDHPGCTAEGNFAEPGQGGLRQLCVAHVPPETWAMWRAQAGERREVAA